MRYLTSEGMWLLPSPEGFDCEVVVSGNEVCPDAERLELVRTALAALSNLNSRGVGYLESFVDRTKVGRGDDWNLVGVESGRREERSDQLTLHYAVGADIYGDWFVTFQRSSGKDFPVAFGRKQV